MTIIKQADAAIQAAVDTAAFAIMRRFGCSKAPLRFALMVTLVAALVAEAALDHSPWKLLIAFALLVAIEFIRRRDVASYDRGMLSPQDQPWQWFKILCAVMMVRCLVSGDGIGALCYATGALLEYLSATPPTPPPSRETSRELATAGGVA